MVRLLRASMPFFWIKCHKAVWKISEQLGGSNPCFKTRVVTGKSWLYHGLWKIPVCTGTAPNQGFGCKSRVNHGYNTSKSWFWGWKPSHPRLTCISGGVCQKKHEKRLLQTAPMLVKSNEKSLNVKFICISSHPKNGVNLGFWPKTEFSGVKPGLEV